MRSGMAKAQSLKKVVNCGGHGVDGSGKFELIGGEFCDGCFDACRSKLHDDEPSNFDDAKSPSD